MRVAVIGGGAAGYFAAISCKRHHPDASVVLFEKTSKTLSKVKISGGGRCNVTHDCQYISHLVKNYPRGGKQLKKVFEQFSHRDTVEWFESRGVPLKVEADGRIFPVSDQSESIIRCLLDEVDTLGIDVQLRAPVQHISKSEDEFQLEILGRETTVNCDIVIITTGGHPKSQGYDWLRALDLKIIDPVPSLFTFNMPDDPIKTLMGIAVPAYVRILGSTFNEEGPVLITHWGMSGPAVLRLSAWGARHLSCEGYEFILSINWSNGLSEQGVRELLSTDNRRKLRNANPLQLPVRLWEALMDRASVDANLSWYDSPKKSKNKLIHTITQDHYQVSGKTTFKEEFVTCGGVALDQINLSNMSSKDIPGLYLAGEVLDIDAITGGFNFQAAWSTGYVAGMCKP